MNRIPLLPQSSPRFDIPPRADYDPALSMKDLYPMQLISVIGGVEALFDLREIPQRERPPFSGADLFTHRERLIEKQRNVLEEYVADDPEILRGFDKRCRPFLEVTVPGWPSLVYYPNVDPILNLDNWEVAIEGDGFFSLGSKLNEERKENALLLLAKIMKGEDCTEARKGVGIRKLFC